MGFQLIEKKKCGKGEASFTLKCRESGAGRSDKIYIS